MSAGTQLYITTIVVYAAVYMMACLGLSIQYGYAGIINFAYIVFQAAGAYTAAVLSIGPAASSGGFQHYIGGYRLPFPIPLLAAAAVGGLLSTLLGLLMLRRLRRDYQAIAFLVLSVIATDIVENAHSLMNGEAGLSLIPSPLQSALHLSYLGYLWAYAGYSVVLAVLVYLLVRRVSRSPLALAWRASRDNEASATALGKDLIGLRVSALALGGCIAGLSGAVLAEFITVWSTNSWLFPETLVLFTALIVGGLGNNIGAIVGALLVPILILQGTTFLPEIGRPGLIDQLDWVLVGLLTLLFLWFLPDGVVPERPQLLMPREGAPASGRRIPDMRARLRVGGFR